MRGFYSYDELWEKIDEQVAAYPEIIISKFSIGKTHSGKDIWALQIADITGLPLDERSGMMITGATHSRELVSASYSLFILKTLTENVTSELKYLLQTRTMFLIPILNVEGYTRISEIYAETRRFAQIRKNLNPAEKCSDPEDIGVDLNRNFGQGWGHDN
jgi:carboxypeptidase T